MFCVNCGKEILEEVTFCSHCGKQMDLNNGQVGDKIGKNKTSTLEAMVSKEIPHYMTIFREIERSGRVPGTPLGLIWPFWLLYRKMYKEFFLFWGVGMIIFILPGIGFFASIGCLVYMCINLKKMYYQSILNKLEKHQLTGVDIQGNPQHEMLIKRIGGTSVVGIIIYIISIKLLVIGIIGAIILFAPEASKQEKVTVPEGSSIQQKAEVNKVNYSTKGGELEFTFGKDWRLDNESQILDLECYSYGKGLETLGIVYVEDEVPEGWIGIDLLNFHIEDIKDEIKDFQLVEEELIEIQDDKRFTTVRYQGIDDDGVYYYYYYFTLIEYGVDYKQSIVLIQTVPVEAWEKYKDELQAIAESIKVKQKGEEI